MRQRKWKPQIEILASLDPYLQEMERGVPFGFA